MNRIQLCLIHPDARILRAAERKSCTLLHAMRCCRLSSRGHVSLSRGRRMWVDMRVCRRWAEGRKRGYDACIFTTGEALILSRKSLTKSRGFLFLEMLRATIYDSCPSKCKKDRIVSTVSCIYKSVAQMNAKRMWNFFISTISNCAISDRPSSSLCNSE